MQPNFDAVNVTANRRQYKIKVEEFFFIVKMQPNFDAVNVSANRRQYKIKVEEFYYYCYRYDACSSLLLSSISFEYEITLPNMPNDTFFSSSFGSVKVPIENSP